jgi:gliding motility-associated-like protein
MKKYFLILLLFVLCNTTIGQTFTNNTGGAIPDGFGDYNTTPDPTPDPGPRVCFPINVTGVGQLTAANGLKSVCINITHGFDADLVIFLKAPSGEYIPLSGIPNVEGNGGSGNNYTSTCFTMSATTPISLGTAPFTGNFIPEYSLGWFNDNNINANGTWSLCVEDNFAGDVGTVNNWNITFGANAPPYPVTGCNGNLPANNFCQNATPICNLNGYCGNTSASYSSYSWPELEAAFCNSSIENNSFLKFVANAATAVFNVNVTNSTTGKGIQMLVYAGGCGSGPVTAYGCDNKMLPGINTFIATGLIAGNTYYLMIDGFSGDVCNYSITVTSGVNVLNVTPPSPKICAGGSGVILTASGGNGIYTWSPATGLSATTGAVVTANPVATQTYTVTSGSIGSLNCPLTKTVTVTVNPLPTVISPPQVCVGNTASLSPTTGGTWVSSNPAVATVTNAGVVTGVTPGTITFTFTNTTTGCKQSTNNVSVTAANIVPTFTPFAPICNGATAPILPTTSTNGIVGTWSPATVSNTATGTYTFTPNSGQCASSTILTVTVNPILQPVINCGNSTLTSVTFNWLSLAGATGYSVSYTVNGGAIVNIGVITATTYTVNGLGSGNTVVITVTPTGTGCFAAGTATCSAVTCVAATVALTSAVGTNDQTVCSNNPITVITYNIGGSATGAGVTGLPAGVTGVFNAGILTISGTTGVIGIFSYNISTTGGCSAANATGTLNITARVTPTFAPIPPICVGSTPPVLPTTSVNGITGMWSPVTVSNTTTAVYTFTPNSGQCATTTTITVTVTDANIVPVFDTQSPICFGSTPPILSTTSTNGINGIWNPASVSNVNTTLYTFIPTPNSCATQVTKTVIVLALPNVEIGNDTAICEASSLILNAAITGTTVNYLWQDGSTNATYTVTQAGQYFVRVDNGVCKKLDTIKIEKKLKPSFITVGTSTICQNQSVILSTGLADVALTYLWQDGTTTPTFTVTNAGNYFVEVTNNCGTTKGSWLVENGNCKLWMPNAFSPNNDGINDFFKAAGADNVTQFNMIIYSRYGEKIFETNNVKKGWDGVYKNQRQPLGTYVYYLNYTDNSTGKINTIKGTFILIQ